MRQWEQTEQSAQKPLKTKGWNNERRAAQRARCLAQKPWEKSTGPRTAQGKSIVSDNSYQNGLYCADYYALINMLAQQDAFLRRVRIKNP